MALHQTIPLFADVFEPELVRRLPVEPGEVGNSEGVDLLRVRYMLRKAMSSIIRCRSGEICLVIGVLPLKRSAHAAPRNLTARLRRRGRRPWPGHVAEVILCDI